MLGKLLLFYAFCLASVSALSAYQDMTAAEYSNLINTADSLVLIDVREANEYDSGHIAGAHLFPLNSQVFQKKYRELPAAFRIAINCGSGFRSAQAAAILDTADGRKHAGRVYNLTSGLPSNWPGGLVKGGQDGPSVKAGRDSLAFGTRETGHTVFDTLLIINIASRGTALLRFARADTAFTVRPDTAAVLPGDTLRVAVSFTPRNTTAYMDTLKVFHAGLGQNPLKLVLKGSGAAPVHGDIDASGKVDVFDLLELLKALSGRGDAESRSRSDINADSRVDVFDLLALLKLLSGRG